MHQLTLQEMAQGLADKRFSSLELTEHFLQRIAQFDGEVNSFITVTKEEARQQAQTADQLRAQGQAGVLTGIPIAHKDIFCTEGVKTSCGSKMLDNFISPYDATLIQKYKQAGTVMLGKTNMDEFAMGSSNESSFYGAVRNPWDKARVPGGSSGGSAAAVAARLAPGATGTDTGGSIRQPAALCGITGLKPTYGRVSRYGMVAFASSLDQAGPMAQSAADCALLLQAMAGFDTLDSTSLDESVPDYQASLNDKLDGLTIGLPDAYFANDLPQEIADSIAQCQAELEKLGVRFKSVALPAIDAAIPAYYVIAPAECSSNLSRFDGVRFGHRCDAPEDLQDLYCRSRSEGFGAEVKRRIMVGTYALSAGYYDAYYHKAQTIRRLIRQAFADAFKEVDLLLSPTTPATAFKLGEKLNDPVSMYLSDIYTIAVNLAGLPALSMPAGLSQNLPIGVQLIGNHLQEARLLNVAHRFQQATDWHTLCPEEYR